MHKRIMILQSCLRDHGLIGSRVRFGLVFMAGLSSAVSQVSAQAQQAVMRPATVTTVRPGTGGLTEAAAGGAIAFSGPLTELPARPGPRHAPAPDSDSAFAVAGSDADGPDSQGDPARAIGRRQQPADDGPAAQGHPHRDRRWRYDSRSAPAYR